MTGDPAPLRAPSPSPTSAATTTTPSSPPPNQGLPVHFSPPLIAMVVVVAAAFLVVTYSRLLSRRLILLFRRYRRWSHRRRRRRYHLPSYSSTTFSSLDSPRLPFDSSFSPDDPFQLYSPYGLDDAVVKTIPLSLFTTSYKQNSAGIRDCAVCLLDFEENDYVRTLPVCSHAFHVDCIDIWLRSHANCPLCRAGIFRPESPFVPVMASRIRPSLDDAVFINSVSLLDVHPQTNSQSAGVTNATTVTEITPCIDEPPPRRNSIQNVNDNNSYSEDNNNSSRLLKRSYSFGFERSSFLAASERMMVTEPATASPWRLRRGGFWSKRPLTPFKSRVFSFRYNRGGMIMKSPAFFRRRPSGGGGFFPLSERFSNIGGSSSSRRTKSMASPMFLRSSAAAFSSSRLRCGDPEALLSPERFNNVGR